MLSAAIDRHAQRTIIAALLLGALVVSPAMAGQSAQRDDAARAARAAAQERAAQAMAPLGSATLSGTIEDQLGDPLTDVHLTLSSLSSSVIWRATASAASTFEFRNLPAGSYTLQASRAGFATSTYSGIAVGDDDVLLQRVVMRLGDVRESIRVIASGGRSSPPLPSPRPAAPPCAGGTGCITPPVKLADVLPQYPAEAVVSRAEGTVILEGTIDTQGAVRDVRVLSPVDDALNAAAAEAVRQWQFAPALLNGVPQPVTTQVTVEFVLSAK